MKLYTMLVPGGKKVSEEPPRLKVIEQQELKDVALEEREISANGKLFHVQIFKCVEKVTALCNYPIFRVTFFTKEKVKVFHSWYHFCCGSYYSYDIYIGNQHFGHGTNDCCGFQEAIFDKLIQNGIN